MTEIRDLVLSESVLGSDSVEFSVLPCQNTGYIFQGTRWGQSDGDLILSSNIIVQFDSLDHFVLVWATWSKVIALAFILLRDKK